MPPELAAKQLELATAMLGPGGAFELGAVTLPSTHPCGPVAKGFVRGPKVMGEYFKKYLQAHSKCDFLVFEKERYTFGYFEECVSKIAFQLKNRFGIQQGDRVAVCMRNYPEWCISFVAAVAIGAVAVPLNSWWKSSELEYALQDSGAKVLFCDQERYNYAQEAAARLNIYLVTVRSKKGNIHYPSLLQGGSLCPSSSSSSPSTTSSSSSLYNCSSVLIDKAAAIMYTSGTTGHPKGVIQTHRGICEQMILSEFNWALTQKLRSLFPSALPPLKYQNGLICTVPLFHVTGCHHLFLASMAEGRKVVLMSKWDAGVALSLIEKERPHAWSGVPSMVQDIMEHPNFEKTDVSSLVFVGAGGAPTPPSQVQKIVKNFANAVPAQGYGLTEVNGAITGNVGDEYIAAPSSAGRAVPNVDVRVFSPENDSEVGLGERGEIRVKGAMVMAGYWNKPKETKQVFDENGWFKTGDVGTLDSGGFLRIVDRIKDIVIRGGENISCSEVEGVIHQHPSVMECCVFGLPNERLGEELAVMIQTKKSPTAITPQLLADWLKQSGKLAAFKQPPTKNIFLTTTQLPRGATGKTLRREVRKVAMDQLAASKL